MAKFEIFDKKKKKDKITYLRLMKTDVGVKVIACDEEGIKRTAGNLVTFDHDSMDMRRHSSVNRDLGFELNCDGKVKLREEDDC